MNPVIDFIVGAPFIIQMAAGILAFLAAFFVASFVIPAVFILFRLRGVVRRLRRLKRTVNRDLTPIFARGKTLTHLWTEYRDTLHEQREFDQAVGVFKATVFRSLAGTQSMYQAIALATPQDPTTPGLNAVSQCNVLGSSRRYREQIQIVSGTASSTVQNAAYIFADNMYAGADIDAGNMLTPGTDFTFTPSNPTNGSNATAVITSTSANMPDGLYDLDIEYVPQASRNDPGNTRFGLGGINNRVDVWINGQIGTQYALGTINYKSTQQAGAYTPFNLTNLNSSW